MGEARVHEAPAPLAAAALFQRLWDELVSLLGTTATAALVRRAVKRAGTGVPGLAGLRVERAGLEYTYTLPAPWHDPQHEEGRAAIHRLYAEELDPLLRELTGTVVRRHLARVPELASLVSPQEETP